MRTLVLLAVVIASCARPATTATPTPTASPSMTAEATSSPTPSPAPTAQATATPSTRYTSTELGYSLDLLPGWRRAACSPGIRQISPVMAYEFFTHQSEADEVFGFGSRFLGVRVEQSEGLTPIAWLESGKFSAGEPVRYEATQLDGRAAATARLQSSGETVAWAVAARGWIYLVDIGGPIGNPALDRDLARILPTIRILDDATLGRGAATPAPRSIETVADGLADGFARRDTSALAAFITPCVTVGAVPGDAVLRSRVGYLNDIRALLDAGTTVRVQARPIESESFGRFVRSTWSRPGQPDQRIDLVLSANGERWSMSGALTRAFGN